MSLKGGFSYTYMPLHLRHTPNMGQHSRTSLIDLLVVPNLDDPKEMEKLVNDFTKQVGNAKA